MTNSLPISTVRSAAILMLRDNVDTDQIIPARFLKAVDKDGLADRLFADWRYGPEGALRSDFVLNHPESRGRRILVVGDNFGCGSSREHAPWALLAWGIQAVIATSFADIFRSNALKNGLLPIELAAETHVRLVALIQAAPYAEVVVDLETEAVRLPDGTIASFEVDPFARSMLLAGTDELGYLLSLESAIAGYEAARPARIDTLPPS
jgi:3-isopropylmalate/(R)-2-methylmalate dehydratase small subunit